MSNKGSKDGEINEKNNDTEVKDNRNKQPHYNIQITTALRTRKIFLSDINAPLNKPSTLVIGIR